MKGRTKLLKFFLTGVAVTIGLAIFCRDIELLFHYSICFGVGCLGLAGIFSGVFGDHYEMVFYTENREDREARWKRVSRFVALGAPAIVTGIIIYFLIY